MPRRDFTVLFGLETDGAHLLSLLESPGGTASGRFVSPFPPGDFWRSIAGAAEDRRDIASPGSAAGMSVEEGRRLGGELFEALFAGKVKEAFQQSRNSGLRLKLRFDPGLAGATDLAWLPWEAMFQPQDGFLGLSRLNPIVRFLEGPGPTQPLPLPRPLRILAVVSSPSDARTLSLTWELQRIEKALEGRRGVELTVLRNPQPGTLRDALHANRPFHVFHFMGHGGFDQQRQEGYLFLAEPDRRARKLWATELAQRVHDAEDLRLVVLNACSTARSPGREAREPFAGVASALVQAGIPAVVAMMAPIRDALAIAFAGAFYNRLVKGDPVELAAIEGRFAIDEADPEGMAWAIPAVFLRIPDGRLFAGGAHDPTVDGPGVLRRYLDRLVERTRELPLPGLAGTGLRPATALDDLFVEPRCRRPGGESLRLTEGVLGKEQPSLQGDPVMGRPSRVVLLGEAGAGKSTALRWLALRLARRRLEQSAAESPPAGEAPVPILLRAADCARSLREGRDSSLADFLAGGAGSEEEILELNEVLLDRLQEGDAVVLLDGLDEISDPEERSRMGNEIGRLVAPSNPASRGSRWIVSSRTVEYAAVPLGPGTEILFLQPFGDEEIEAFCRLWTAAMPEAGPGTFAVSSPSRALAGNPLLLSLLAGLPDREEPPVRRITLLSAAVDTLLGAGLRRFAAARTAISKVEILDLLALVAAEAQDGSGTIGWALLRQIARRSAKDGDVEAVVQTLLGSGLLVPVEKGLHAFPHSLFREYFAGCWLAAEAVRRPAVLREKLDDPLWWEPVRIALGRLSEDLDEPALRTAVRSLLDGGDSFGGLVPRTALFVASALPEMKRAPSGLVEELTGRLLRACAAAGPEPELLLPVEAAFDGLFAGEHREVARRTLALELTPAGAELGTLPVVAALLRRAGPWSASLTGKAAELADLDSAEWGWPVDGLLRDAAGAEPPRLPEPTHSLRQFLRQSPELAQRVSTHPGWLSLVAAVYGGLIPGHGFSVERIHRGSPLTKLFFEALEAGGEPRDLVELLLERIRDAEDLAAATDALVALTVLGEPTADLLQSESPAARRARIRLAALARRLRDCMPELVPPALDALRTLAGRVSPEVWIDLVAAVLQTLVRFGGSPGAILDLEDCAPPSVRPALLAEVWHLPFASESPAYSLAVLLDVAGEPLSSPPLHLAGALATAGRASLAPLSRSRGWDLRPSENPPRTRSSVLAAALDALEALVEPFDFFRGWALTRLALLLTAEGMIAESLAMALGGVSDRLGTRKDAVDALLAAAGLKPADPQRPDVLERRLLAMAGRIRDGEKRRHAFARIARHLPHLGADCRLLGDPLPSLSAVDRPPEVHDLPPAAPRLLAHESVLTTKGAAPLLLAAVIGDLDLPGGDLPAAGIPGPAKLSAKTIQDLLKRLEGEDDLESCRAALALHGDRSELGLRLSATAVGREGLVALARRWREAEERRPAVAQVVRWALERIRHDDPEALAQWTEQVAGAGEGARDAELLLGWIHDLHPRAWPAFRAAANEEPTVRRALFHSLCHLAVRRRLPEARWRELAPVLRSWSFEEVAADHWIPDLPAALVESAEAGLGAVEAAVTAEDVLALRRRPLADLFRGAPSSWPEAFRAAGSMRLASGLYRASLKAAAGRLERRPELLAVLAAWIVHRLESRLRDASPYCQVTDDLLSLLALAAERSPQAFTGRVPDVPAVDEWLRQATERRASFHGRRAAITLLAHLRTLSVGGVFALRSTLRDVAEVRDEALRTASLYRDAEPEALDELLSDLESGSPLAAHGAVRVLTALVRSGRLRRGDRAEIVRRVTPLLDGARPGLEIFTLTVKAQRVRLVSPGRLKADLYGLMAAYAGPALPPEREGA